MDYQAIVNENAFWDGMARQKAARLQAEQLYDQAFTGQLNKIASQDPQFAASLEKQASIEEWQATRALFEQAFEEKIASFAAEDPSYAQALEYQATKEAFNQGFYQTLAEAGGQ